MFGVRPHAGWMTTGGALDGSWMRAGWAHVLQSGPYPPVRPAPAAGEHGAAREDLPADALLISPPRKVDVNGFGRPRRGDRGGYRGP